jgi:hypothetical protein
VNGNDRISVIIVTTEEAQDFHGIQAFFQIIAMG